MTDDTSYLIGFEQYDEAYVAMLYLYSPRVRAFLKSVAFQDAKRPYTKKVLSRLSFDKIIKTITMDELLKTEQDLNLKPKVTASMVESFAQLVADKN